MPIRAAVRPKTGRATTVSDSREPEMFDGILRVPDASVVVTDRTTVDEHLNMAESLWQASGSRGTELALPHYEAAAALAKEAGDHMKECMIAVGHGYALRHLGRQAAARALLRKAKRMAEKHDCDEAVAFVDRVFHTEIGQQDLCEKEVCEMWRSFATDKSSAHPVSLFIRSKPMETHDAASGKAVRKMRAIGVTSVHVVDVSCAGADLQPFPPGLLNIAKSPHVSFPQLYLHGQEVLKFLKIDDEELREMMHNALVEMKSPQQSERKPPSFDVQSEAKEGADLSGKNTQRSPAKSKKGKRKSKVSTKMVDAQMHSCKPEEHIAKDRAASDDTGLPNSNQSEVETNAHHVHDPLDACGSPIRTLMDEDGFADENGEANNVEETEGHDGADCAETAARDEVPVVEDLTASCSELRRADTIANAPDQPVSIEDDADVDDASCSAGCARDGSRRQESRCRAGSRDAVRRSGSSSFVSKESRCRAGSTDSTSDGSRRQAGDSPTFSAASSDTGADASADAECSGIDDIGLAPRAPCGADSTGSVVMPARAFELPPLSPFLVDPPLSPSAGPPQPSGFGAPGAPHGPSFRPPPGLAVPASESLRLDQEIPSAGSAAALAEENDRLRQVLAQQASELEYAWRLVSELAKA